MRTGRFLPGPNSLEGKWFAENAKDAARWGEAFGGKFRIIEIDLPNDVARTLMRIEKLDNIGPARYAELEQLVRAIIRGEVKK